MMVTEGIAPALRPTPRDAGLFDPEVDPRGGHPESRGERAVRRCRILLVDNSPILIRALEGMLASIAWIEVIGSASSGQMALKLIQDLVPDVVLLDFAMPGMGGLEVASRLAARPGRPIVIVLTAHDDEAYRRAAFEAGADGFLVKVDLSNGLVPLIISLRCRGGEAGWTTDGC